jgi:hypothetical protein
VVNIRFLTGVCDRDWSGDYLALDPVPPMRVKISHAFNGFAVLTKKSAEVNVPHVDFHMEQYISTQIASVALLLYSH